VKGTIELFDVQDGIWTPRVVISNNIMNTGYDAMARAFAGDSNYVVNGMYIEYTNSTPVEPTIPVTRTTSYYQNLSSPFGYVRIRTLSQPIYTTSDASKYQSNVVTLLGVTDGTSQAGASIIDGTSQFISLALVSMPELGEVSTDTLVSAAAIKDGSGTFSPITKLANSQLGFKWSLELGG
jgi:hypothetical protein